MAITYSMDGSVRKRKGSKIAMDLDSEKKILDARTNKKAIKEAGEDQLLDEIFNRKKKKRGRVQCTRKERSVVASTVNEVRSNG